MNQTFNCWHSLPTRCEVTTGHFITDCPRLHSTSNRLPSLPKHVVDEFGHRLRAAVATSVCPVLQVLHRLSDQSCKEVGDILVALSSRDFLEGAVVLLCQAAALLLVHLPHVTQVLLVPHQTHRNLHLPKKREGGLVRNRRCGVLTLFLIPAELRAANLQHERFSTVLKHHCCK